LTVIDTDRSLLDRLRSRSNDEDWFRLVGLYQPFVYGWLCHSAVPPADAEMLTQDIMSALVKKLPKFRHNGRPGAFRKWLIRIAKNQLLASMRTGRRRAGANGVARYVPILESLEDPGSDLSRRWDEDHLRYIRESVQDLVEREVPPDQWMAYRRLLLDEAKAAEVADELKVPVRKVYQWKDNVCSRLRKRLRRFR
jgi:RNA polymerase sigma-70 factor (ECF subfamily)